MKQSTASRSCLSSRKQMPSHSREQHPASISISLFENEIPDFVEAELERLYENLFSSLALFRAFGMDKNVHTYVARKDGQVTTIFLFRREKSTVTVLNEQIGIDADALHRFADHLFARYRTVRIINFQAISTNMQCFPYPYQRARFTNDIVLMLPNSAEEYLTRLGKSTRQNIRYSLKKIQKDFPTFSYRTMENDHAAGPEFHDILALNRARMAKKNKIAGVDDREAERLLALAKTCGQLGIVTIDGQICAGTVCYRVGANYFLRIIAHDSRFNVYGLGMLCCYLTIGTCIAQGGRQYHFMWGREEYKYRLLGQQRDFDTVTLYRSRFSYLLDGRRIIKAVIRSRLEQVKFRLLDARNQNAPAALLAQALFSKMRILKSKTRRAIKKGNDHAER